MPFLYPSSFADGYGLAGTGLSSTPFVQPVANRDAARSPVVHTKAVFFIVAPKKFMYLFYGINSYKLEFFLSAAKL